MRMFGNPRWEVELDSGECIKIPKQFQNYNTDAASYEGMPVLVHPEHKPMLLGEKGWEVIENGVVVDDHGK